MTKYLLALLISANAFAADIEIKSGPNGNYCTPMGDPRCKSHFNMEMERRWENKQRNDRYQDMERREIQRDNERRSYERSERYDVPDYRR